jgi:hypothetical protein
VENELRLDESVKAKVNEHLRGLGTTFRECFPAMSDDNNWIRNPSDNAVIFTSNTLSTEEKEQLIEICTEYGSRNSFKRLPPINFWLGLRN